MPKSEEKLFKLHGIQLEKVNIVELYIKSNQPPDESIGIDEVDMPFLVGHTEFDEESRQIAVMVKLEIIDDEEAEITHPFFLRVEIVGEFRVDEKFPSQYINDWARRNAPFILMPYLREQVYSLTSKCGFRPIILPLLEVPSLTSDCHN